ncbi:MAG: hypothetical protein WDN06_11850 [Asticcacaulis sp.]
MGGETHVSTTTAGDQSLPAIVTLNDGGYVITWGSGNDAGWGIYAQRYDASGAVVGGRDPTSTPRLSMRRPARSNRTARSRPWPRAVMSSPGRAPGRAMAAASICSNSMRWAPGSATKPWSIRPQPATRTIRRSRPWPTAASWWPGKT